MQYSDNEALVFSEEDDKSFAEDLVLPNDEYLAELSGMGKLKSITGFAIAF